MANNSLQRCWINQPSTLQPAHKLHGMNVLADIRKDGSARVYPVDGNVISMEIPRGWLSAGWIKEAE